MAGLASVLASVNQLAKQLNDSLKHILLNCELIHIYRSEFGTDSNSTKSRGLKSFKAKLQDKVARTVASEMHADIVAVSKELKEYTIENLHEKDFLFTDWINGNTSLGIYGPEEVWKRIAEYAGLAEG